MVATVKGSIKFILKFFAFIYFVICVVEAAAASSGGSSDLVRMRVLLSCLNRGRRTTCENLWPPCGLLGLSSLTGHQAEPCCGFKVYL